MERKYGTVSGYKMYPFGRAREEFVEDEHPRDTGGQFTSGGGSPQTKLPDYIPKPEDRPSGDNYRVEAKKAMLEGRIRAEVEFIKGVKAKGQLQPERIKELENATDKVRKQILTLEEEDKKFGLPKIPMGKNTHTKNKDGYIYNKTKINIQLNVKNDLVANMLQARVQGMWNSLPDDVRDIIGTLNVKKSTSKGKIWRGGSYNHELKTLNLNINNRSMRVDHNFFHEVGHAKWDHLRDKNPEKIQKFIDTQKEIGTSPTAYSRSFLLIKGKNENNERSYRKKMKERNLPISEEGEKRLEQNRKAAEDLYYNETHSELNAYAMGMLSNQLITASKDDMTKLINAYKELWGYE